MKTLFDIRSDATIDGKHSLLAEIGKDYCCYGYWHRPANKIDRLYFASFDEKEAATAVVELLQNIEDRNFQSIYVSSAFEQALLVPTKYFANDYSALDIVYDQPLQTYKNDAIPEWQMVNIYSLSQELHQHLEACFSSINYVHAYTPAIKVYNGFVADNQLSVHFTPQHFRVLLKKDSAIHLAQTYSYTTPLDVVYYLLKICLEFELEQSTVHVILSGLIEENSSLFKELHQYFTNVHFVHPPEIKLPGDSHPHHFFASLYNLASCVS